MAKTPACVGIVFALACQSACVVGDGEPDDALEIEGRGASATLSVGPEAIWAGSDFYVSGCGYAYNKQNPVTVTLLVKGPQEATLTAGVSSTGCLTGSSDLPAGPTGTVAAAGDYTITASVASNGGRTTQLATSTFKVVTAPASTCHLQFAARAPIPASISYAPTVGLGGKLYTFGGVMNNAAYTTQSFRYDPSTDTWAAIAPMPSTLELGGATTDGTYAYIVGPKGRWTGTTVFRYDPSAGTYTELATSPLLDGWAAQSNAVVLYLGGKIYYFGGAPAEWYCTGYPNLAVYDIASDTWTTAMQFPNDFTCSMSGFAYNGSLYAAGGLGLLGGTMSAKTYRYDPAQNAWDDASMADLPMPRGGAASGQLGGLWVLAGGDANNSAITWDPATNRWSSAGSYTRAYASSSAVVGSTLYVVGGGTSGTGTVAGTCN